MEMVNLSLPAGNQFATDYLSQVDKVNNFYHYTYSDNESYKQRVKELEKRQFMRNELADHIAGYMRAFPQSDKVQQNIARLREDNSVVVIGGQQAGILTGPLYSIHKIISIILLADKKEKELKIPVIPVFWIAGEDHDYLEVNHVFVPGSEKMVRKTYPQRVIEKKMASDIELDKEVFKVWAEKLIKADGETTHSKHLLALVKEAAEASETFVDVFSYLVMQLFSKFGLLIVDSGNKDLRTLEKEIFLNQISQFKEIGEAVSKQQSLVKESGYATVIEMSENPVNLFYYDEDNSERILLTYDEEKQQFVGKDQSVHFTAAELKEIASEFPHKLSNNVVTRPIMQDLLFPTLAFIGGPGEIAYWAELKQAFEQMSIKMPPIVPRLNITLLERCVEADLEELGLELSDVIKSGTEEACNAFLASVSNEKVDLLLTQLKQDIADKYTDLQGEIKNDMKGLLPILKKNESLLQNQVDFLAKKVELELKNKHEVILSKFNRIERCIRPDGIPQERVWNVFYFLNHFGLDFLEDVLMLPMEFDGTHKVVKM
ncbi:bacillithiol biosynthesis cysteine-adding enzyme BshC [Niallia taxi]|uniref:bacillithiol biosynthesis cysteine-adding enzyme BshC n=1 Tax=Niallia taxi TaxID=2499688 RepID=UPI00254F4F2F|nr:bacillithiol biosynthesis cysteine-adding enzyme BshC [Niallia taxi]MDK8638751.1 bacillithiol biosynthesis cysteine-adding enzyme BshC [Niallia taxi]